MYEAPPPLSHVFMVCIGRHLYVLNGIQESKVEGKQRLMLLEVKRQTKTVLGPLTVRISRKLVFVLAQISAWQAVVCLEQKV